MANVKRPVRTAREFQLLLALRILSCAVVLTAASTRGALAAQGEGTAGQDPSSVRKQALDLYLHHECLQALPLLEKLVAEKPDDADLEEGYGACLLTKAATLQDAEAVRQTRLESRKALLHAKALGDQKMIVQVLLEIVPENGAMQPFSDRADVEKLMRSGEDAFAKRDFETALSDYQAALTLDPHQYYAALFTGDVYFSRKEMDKAGEWFGRAIEINPDIETAYRYWGDALMSEGKASEAESQYVAAVIRQPFMRTTWLALARWARSQKLELARLAIQIPAPPAEQGGKTVITLDPNQPPETSAAWFGYQGTRALWKKEKFAKEFPDEKTYRHTLKEESEALNTAVDIATEMNQKDSSKGLEPSLAALTKLKKEGLLEAWIFFARADEGIVKDYDEYRREHAEELRRYLLEYVVPKPALAN